VTRLLPTLPPNAPRSGGNALSRWVGRTILRLGGWKVVGEWPDLTKVVVIAAPHSSAWDAVWSLAAKVATGLGATFIAKAELFRGPLGGLLRRFGGRPVDRSTPGGIVEQVARQFRQADRFWFALAPEGTRQRVERWKPGFWKIAKRAGVPVFCVWFHYPERTLGLGPLVELSDDMEADFIRIRQLFANYQGKHRGAM
jgi:1-acyl-sn-glycerol-3-phosphate acyltransferase